MERDLELLEAIFDESTDAIFLVDPVSLLTLDCNRRAVELFETRSRQELIGIEGHTLQKHPFSPTQVNWIVEEIERKGFWSLELEYVTKRGRSFWGNLSVKQIWVKGDPINLVRVTDISERKQLDKETELQAFVIRNIAEGVCLARASDGKIVYTNASFDRLFGYDSGELIEQHVSVLNYDDQANALHISREILSGLLVQGEYTYEIQNVKKDGTPFWSRSIASMFRHLDHGVVFALVKQDITLLKQWEEDLNRSLHEKEILLKEVHHRVKNNLQIIISLIQMQLRRYPNPETLNVLVDCQNRISAIALAYEKLYPSDDLTQIDLSKYIPSLIHSLTDSFPQLSDPIQIAMDIEPLTTDIDTAITYSLIINELISNALKYAFPEDGVHLSTHPNQGNFRLTYPQIWITLQRIDPTQVLLIIQDNGIGIRPTIEIESTSSMGLRLVRALVTQLNGSIQIHRRQGTFIEIRSPLVEKNLI